MSCEIIQLSTAARTARKAGDRPAAEVTAIGDRVLTPRQQRREGRPQLPPPETGTAKNSRIRRDRRDAWWIATRLTEYWQARRDWHCALLLAQKHGLGDSALFSLPAGETHWDLLEEWRDAVVKQLLTPAPDVAAVNWKRAKLAGSGFAYLPTNAKRIEYVIAKDVEFLTAHPTRRKREKCSA